MKRKENSIKSNWKCTLCRKHKKKIIIKYFPSSYLIVIHFLFLSYTWNEKNMKDMKISIIHIYKRNERILQHCLPGFAKI